MHYPLTHSDPPLSLPPPIPLLPQPPPLQGGGLVKIHTSLATSSPQHVTVVCGKKTTVMEAVQVALSKIGKLDLDCKR